MNQYDQPTVIHGYTQPTEMFHDEPVDRYCSMREQEIRSRIQSMPHNEAATFDKQTLFARLVDLYLSGETTNYPILNIDKADLKSSSNTTELKFLYTVPFEGDYTYFTYKPVGKFLNHSDEVTIHLDDFEEEITFYYKFERDDEIEKLQSKLQRLLTNDVA